MAKKYLTVEETAQRLAMKIEDLNRLRERGEIRGFSDRGTWKFKVEDVEKLSRQRQADSDPDVQILSSETASVEPSPSSDDIDILGSDSDVRIVLDKSLAGGESGDSEPDVQMIQDDDDSDSDVRVADSPKEGDDSDSDVRLVSDTVPDTGSDSDVRLITEDEEASDSDVQLVGHGKAEDWGTDSDVQLVGRRGPDSDVKLTGGQGAPKEEEEEDEGVLSLSSDSGETKASRKSGDSGVPLVADSGVSLERPADSGISLDVDSDLDFAGDSGISLADSGARLRGQDDDASSGTIPMLRRPGHGGETKASVPEAESDFELATTGDEDSGDDTSVVMFDEEDGGAETAAVIPQLTSDDDDLIDESVFEVEELEEFEGAEELEDLDMFGDDDEFGAEPETGESREFAGAYGVPVAREADWGVWTFSGLAVSSVLLLVCWMLMFELVRSMWLPQESSLSNALLSVFGGFF